MEIKVLGPGCSKCKKAEAIVRETVSASGVDATVEKVTDMMKIAGYGVLGTPACRFHNPDIANAITVCIILVRIKDQGARKKNSAEAIPLLVAGAFRRHQHDHPRG